MLWKFWHIADSICPQIWKTQQWSQDWERSVFNPIPKKGNAKECSNYRTIALISHASQSNAQNSPSQASNSMWTINFLMFKLDLEKAEEPEIKLPASVGSSKKQGSSRKTSAAAAKPLQSCPTLCDPIDGSPPGSPVPGILQAKTVEWFAISISNARKWKVKVKSLSPTLSDPMDWSLPGSSVHGIFQAEEYWSGVPLPSLR